MNNTIFFYLNNLTHKSAIFDCFVIFCAQYLLYISIIFVLFYVIKKNSDNLFDIRKPFNEIKIKFNNLVSIFAPVFIAWVFSSTLKDIFMRPRPFILFADKVKPLFLHGGMDSFPSGHATFFAALALSSYFVDKKLGYICSALAIIVGISRVIAGVHFPLDILVGYILGIIIVLIFRLIFKANKV